MQLLDCDFQSAARTTESSPALQALGPEVIEWQSVKRTTEGFMVATREW